MNFASWLLVTSAFVTPPAPAAQQRAPQPVPPSVSSPAHRLGLGGSLTVSNYGAAGSVRYWFSKHVGLSMQSGYYKPRTYGYQTVYGPTSTPKSSTYTATPAVMVQLNATDPTRAVSVRPFFGLGATYAHASRTAQTITQSPITTTYSATTTQEFGGVEMMFRDYENLALSIEGSYVKAPSTFLNRGYLNGFNMQVSVHFYLK